MRLTRQASVACRVARFVPLVVDMIDVALDGHEVVQGPLFVKTAF